MLYKIEWQLLLRRSAKRHSTKWCGVISSDQVWPELLSPAENFISGNGVQISPLPPAAPRSQKSDKLYREKFHLKLNALVFNINVGAKNAP